MKNKLMPYGLKHEVAKRWPIYDWYKSRKVAQLINPSIADTEIINLIQWGKPALVGRLGGTEARFLGEFQKISSVPFLSQMILNQIGSKDLVRLIRSLDSILKQLVR